MIPERKRDWKIFRNSSSNEWMLSEDVGTQCKNLIENVILKQITDMKKNRRLFAFVESCDELEISKWIFDWIWGDARLAKKYLGSLPTDAGPWIYICCETTLGTRNIRNICILDITVFRHLLSGEWMKYVQSYQKLCLCFRHTRNGLLFSTRNMTISGHVMSVAVWTHTVPTMNRARFASDDDDAIVGMLWRASLTRF